MTAERQLVAAGRTDVGRERPHDEDAIHIDEEAGLLVLADGMGGYNAGEVASRLAVESVAEVVRSATELDRGPRLLEEAIVHANRSIRDAAADNSEHEGMGTTIVAGLLCEGSISIAHVGDSRLYRYRDGKLERMTTDHSLTQELLEQGYYTQAEARRANNRHVVTRALGVRDSVEVASRLEPVAEGDIFLLCSDGLTDLVDDHSIQHTLKAAGEDLEQTTEQLIERANALGGHDNIGVIIGRVAGREGGRLTSVRARIAGLLGR